MKPPYFRFLTKRLQTCWLRSNVPQLYVTNGQTLWHSRACNINYWLRFILLIKLHIVEPPWGLMYVHYLHQSIGWYGRHFNKRHNTIPIFISIKRSSLVEERMLFNGKGVFWPEILAYAYLICSFYPINLEFVATQGKQKNVTKHIQVKTEWILSFYFDCDLWRDPDQSIQEYLKEEIKSEKKGHTTGETFKRISNVKKQWVHLTWAIWK